MPYRRLPNTDSARLRALKAAAQHAEENKGLGTLAMSERSAMSVVSFTPMFEQTLAQMNDIKNKQLAASKAVSDTGKVARLYLSHFVQVLNMCIARGEIKPEVRNLLGLEEAAVPDISGDSQLIEWGHKIVEGEEKRMSMGGGNRIYNPSIALVKVKLQIFEENYNKYKDSVGTSMKYHDKIDEMREKADALILELWNEIEAKYSPVDSDEKREECQKCGVVYFYRPVERQRDFLAGQMTDIDSSME
ncbi:MAG: hypothetical protein II951_07130 [Bacteroidales bacterium]|nr:hypothetical protein [Bacteroidales bacterium]